MIVLAAAAAVTERIRLVTDVLIAPLRSNTALLAKQTATVVNLSNGRLVLGLSPGGREDEPRTMALFYFSLGDRAEEVARKNHGDYHGWLGPYAAQIAEGAAKDEDAVREYIASFEEVGVDEVICFPASPDPAQVGLLATAIGRG